MTYHRVGVVQWFYRNTTPRPIVYGYAMDAEKEERSLYDYERVFVPVANLEEVHTQLESEFGTTFTIQVDGDIVRIHNQRGDGEEIAIITIDGEKHVPLTYGWVEAMNRSDLQ